MSSFLSVLEFLSACLCRHEWVRDRQPDGELMLRCMKCGKMTEHRFLQLIRSKLDYTPVDPAKVSDLPTSLHAKGNSAA